MLSHLFKNGNNMFIEVEELNEKSSQHEIVDDIGEDNFPEMKPEEDGEVLEREIIDEVISDGSSAKKQSIESGNDNKDINIEDNIFPVDEEIEETLENLQQESTLNELLKSQSEILKKSRSTKGFVNSEYDGFAVKKKPEILNTPNPRIQESPNIKTPPDPDEEYYIELTNLKNLKAKINDLFSRSIFEATPKREIQKKSRNENHYFEESKEFSKILFQESEKNFDYEDEGELEIVGETKKVGKIVTEDLNSSEFDRKKKEMEYLRNKLRDDCDAMESAVRSVSMKSEEHEKIRNNVRKRLIKEKLMKQVLEMEHVDFSSDGEEAARILLSGSDEERIFTPKYSDIDMLSSIKDDELEYFPDYEYSSKAKINNEIIFGKRKSKSPSKQSKRKKSNSKRKREFDTKMRKIKENLMKVKGSKVCFLGRNGKNKIRRKKEKYRNSSRKHERSGEQIKGEYEKFHDKAKKNMNNYSMNYIYRKNGGNHSIRRFSDRGKKHKSMLNGGEEGKSKSLKKSSLRSFRKKYGKNKRVSRSLNQSQEILEEFRRKLERIDRSLIDGW